MNTSPSDKSVNHILASSDGKDSPIFAGYADWIQNISSRYRQSQIKAVVAANTEMLRFYFSLGRDITLMEDRQPWGSGFLKKLSMDLKMTMSGAEGFSYTNLRYMRYFFKLYAETLICHQVGDKLGEENKNEPNANTMNQPQPIYHQAGDKLYVLNFEEIYPNVARLIFSVPWRHHIAIIDKFRTQQKAALFYVTETVKNGWSRAVLLNFLDTQLHERQGKAITNFVSSLPPPDSELAQEVTKDPYMFDFISLTSKYREKELKDALMTHVEHFLLELGQGFMLVGREFRLEIGSKEKFIDLLFFHMNLNRYIVVEVKTTEFESEYLGQMGFMFQR